MAITSTQPKTAIPTKVGAATDPLSPTTTTTPATVADTATTTAALATAAVNPIGTGVAKLLDGDTQNQDNSLQLLKYDGYAVANAQAALTTLKASNASTADIATATDGLNTALKTYADDLTLASSDTHLNGARINRYLTGGAHPVPDNALIPESGADLTDFIASLTSMETGDVADPTGTTTPATTTPATTTPDTTTPATTTPATTPSKTPTATSKASGNLLLTAAQQATLMDASQVLATDTIDGVTSGSLASTFSLYPNKTPDPTDINQQADEDCYYLGSLASMASTTAGQATLQNAISEPDANGDYTVKLYDPKNNPVEIKVNPNNMPVKADGTAAFNEGTDGKANWANVLEAAYAKYNDVYRTNTDTENATLTGYDGIMQTGVDDTSFVQALTGVTDVKSNTIDTGASASATAAIAASMTKRLTSGVPVLAYNTDPTDVTDTANRTWVAGHAYAVTNVTTDANGQSQVTIQNPWGENTPQSGFKDGVTTMSMADFMKTFEYSLY